MSIFSRAKKTFKSVASKVVNVAKNSFAAVVAPLKQSSGRSSLPKSQPDYTGLNYVEKKTLSGGSRPNDILSGGLKSGALKVISPGSSGGLLNTRNSSGGSRLNASSLTGGGLDFANSYGGYTPTPVTIQGGQRRSSGLSSPSNPSSAPTTLGADSPFGRSSADNLSLNSGSLSSAPSIALPSAPSYSDVGAINNAGLIGALSETQTYNPENGLFIPNQEVDQTEEERRKNDFQELLDMTPKKESVLDDREVRRQKAEVRARQEEVNNYTGQLNSLVAKQNADLLRTRGTLSEEGGTETVYGGIAATINREAAIKALPIQAQIAAAQGNLELATDYLSEVIAIKKEQIDADYEYNTMKFKAIEGFLSKEEKIRLDKITKNEDRAYDRAQKNLDLQDSWAKTAIENGQNHLVSRIHSLSAGDPDFQQKLGQIIAGIQDKDAGSGSGNVALTAEDRRILAGGGFSANEIDSIASDVSEYGIDAVLEGLNPRQQQAVMSVYGGGDGATRLTRSSVANFFGMPDNNELSGFLGVFGKGKTNSEKLDDLMSAIEKYQSVGYSDEAILKLMKEQD